MQIQKDVSASNTPLEKYILKLANQMKFSKGKGQSIGKTEPGKRFMHDPVQEENYQIKRSSNSLVSHLVSVLGTYKT